MNSQARISLVLAAIAPVAAELVMIVMLSRQQHFDSSGSLAALVYTATLFGTALMGVVGGLFLRSRSNRAIGIWASLLSAMITLVAVFHNSPVGNLVLVGTIFFVCALENPNINGTLNRLLSAKGRASGFSQFHTIYNAALMGAPIIAVGLVHSIGGRATLGVAAICFLISALPWVVLPKFVREASGEPAKWWQPAGYHEIVRNVPLRELTLSRLLNNLIYTAIPVAIPILAAGIATSSDEFLWIQGAALSALRAGAFVASVAAAVVLVRHPAWSVHLARATTPLGMCCLVALALSPIPVAVVAAAAAAGVGQFSFRLSGLTLGPSVTPPDLLPEVILAGDTVVRLYSSCYSYLVVMSFTVLGGSPIVLLAAAAAASPAPLLIEKAVKSYRRQLGGSEKEAESATVG